MSNQQIKDPAIEKVAKKLAFTDFVNSCKTEDGVWICCDKKIASKREFHRHVAINHNQDVSKRASDLKNNDESCPDLKRRYNKKRKLDSQFEDVEDDNEGNYEGQEWLPKNIGDLINETIPPENYNDGVIVLFYKYRCIKKVERIKNWLLNLCQRLDLTGKVRIASEGVNATLGSNDFRKIKVFVECFKKHPLFHDMTEFDFKMSNGNSKDFPEGLKVGIYSEICRLGINPDDLSFEKASTHISAEKFHSAVEDHLNKPNDNKIFIDCRNYYESKIGCFTGAIDPNIRKFSYWPEYVDKNLNMFKDKEVYMYCTGGIRCERGSAYLKSKGVASDIYQLSGGIHKYLEQFPNGHFKGKLFVFDNRYAISYNDQVIAECCYCKKPWDQYKLCSSEHCKHLVSAVEDNNLHRAQLLINNQMYDIDELKKSVVLTIKRQNNKGLKILLNVFKNGLRRALCLDEPLIVLAARTGNVEILKTLLESGFSIDETNSRNATALYIASYYGYIKAIDVLLQFGADINKATSLASPSPSMFPTGDTPLHAAIQNRNANVVYKLLEYKPKLNFRDSNLKTPLHYAAHTGLCYDALIDAGADLDAVDSANLVPLNYALSEGLDLVVRSLVRGGCSLKSNSGVSFLKQAVVKGHVKALLCLLKGGCSLKPCPKLYKDIIKRPDIFRMLIDLNSIPRKSLSYKFVEENCSEKLLTMLLENGSIRDPIPAWNNITLKRICSLVIRESIGENIWTRAKLIVQLSLPPIMIDFILLRDMLFFDEKLYDDFENWWNG
ncbi:DgyrCDS11911 [Dimorphilus gyrociliatus]|uniref:Thiosulfate sulfurtransferase/rhodanese-like domain-containing protein 2 n=1 Tax=Dimorphilus gyrociliatus TaxID=2664684 RepID=A0A7I8W4U1_9ANNE|nr:DgyrCDS11911 [Dimorphilus gyrociliatus]